MIIAPPGRIISFLSMPLIDLYIPLVEGESPAVGNLAEILSGAET